MMARRAARATGRGEKREVTEQRLRHARGEERRSCRGFGWAEPVAAARRPRGGCRDARGAARLSVGFLQKFELNIQKCKNKSWSLKGGTRLSFWDELETVNISSSNKPCFKMCSAKFLVFLRV